MVQSLIIGALLLLCLFLIVSLFMDPIGKRTRNNCKFKIEPPIYKTEGQKTYISFDIVVEKKHRYFINFPFLFRFFSDKPFNTKINVFYSTPGDSRQLLMSKNINFEDKSIDSIVYITDVIKGKIFIEMEFNLAEGNPEFTFEIMENNTCILSKQQKLYIKL